MMFLLRILRMTGLAYKAAPKLSRGWKTRGVNFSDGINNSG